MSGGNESRCGMRRAEYVSISFFVLICRIKQTYLHFKVLYSV